MRELKKKNYIDTSADLQQKAVYLVYLSVCFFSFLFLHKISIFMPTLNTHTVEGKYHINVQFTTLTFKRLSLFKEANFAW